MWLERKHTTPRQVGAATLSPAPFIASPGGVGGGGTQAVVFDDAVPVAQVNIRSDRATNQSPIDNTKVGITNLGNETGSGLGVTGAYATNGGGDGNVVSGDYATVPGGAGNVASGDGSFAAGLGATASGEAATALGYATASGEGSLASGASTASGQYAVALGNGCTASGSGGQVAMGNGCQASGSDGAIALGNGCTASGEASIAIGAGCTASAIGALATGGPTLASRAFQHAHASGGATQGAYQTSLLVLRGQTVGGAANQAVELKFGSSFFAGTEQLILEDNKAYAIEVTAVAGGVQGGVTRVARTIKQSFVARKAAGVTVIAASGAGEAFGDAATATWTIVPTVGTVPDRIALTFNTGAGTASACSVTARVEFTEVSF